MISPSFVQNRPQRSQPIAESSSTVKCPFKACSSSGEKQKLEQDVLRDELFEFGRDDAPERKAYFVSLSQLEVAVGVDFRGHFPRFDLQLDQIGLAMETDYGGIMEGWPISERIDHLLVIP